ncbi:hypothetical protein [Leptothrix ochracea]|uniref:hypothetical protein n=1 Tax=Leptothrix ochracea TaxID=735331 RepID=UPI0034E27E3D
MLTTKPIIIRIPGDFWDSHIYSSQLYLFGSDKSLQKVDWRALIASHPDFQNLSIAAHGTLVDAGLFYRDDSGLFLADPVVKGHVESCFSAIDGVEVEVDLNKLAKVSHRDSPFPNLHTDCEIYHHRLYAGMPEGLFLANTDAEDGASKLWDAGVFGLKASESYGQVAVAAADEGLWEFSVKFGRRDGTPSLPKVTTKNFCTSCDWGDQSVYAWSASAEGFLASYYTQRFRGENVPQRIFDRAIGANELSHSARTFWGSHGRAYTLDDHGNLEVLDYDSKAAGKARRKSEKNLSVQPVAVAQPLQHRSTKPRSIGGQIGQRKPVAVAAAPFGTVIQFDNSLSVVRSDGELTTIAGDIVTWRVFPRSLHYANQLHVVFEDRLEIYAFLHDYFVDQESKEYGYSV